MPYRSLLMSDLKKINMSEKVNKYKGYLIFIIKDWKGRSFNRKLRKYRDKLDKKSGFFGFKKALLYLDSRGLHKMNIAFKRP